MKAYQSTNNAVELRKRVEKVHSKARFVGTLYLLGALALAVLAFFPALNIGGKDLWVSNFYLPIQNAFGGKFDWIRVITSAFYFWILLVVVINLFICLFKLGGLTRSSSRCGNDYNRNIRAMENMGKRFSGSFATIVNFSLLIYVLQPNASRVVITNYAYIMLVVGLTIHFLAGLIAGKVSWFEVRGNGGNVEEVERECGIFVYFFRNLMQLAAVVGILYFFLPKCTLGATIQSWFGGVNPLVGDFVKNLVPVVLQALIVLCMLVLIHHATATTEFNRLGIEGEGMTNYRVFSFLVCLLAGGAFAFDYFLVKPNPIVYDFAYVAAIAFGVFLVDCIFKTSVNKEDDDDLLDDMENNQVAQPMPVYVVQGMPVQAGQPMLLYQQTPTNQLVYQQQPVYIPVYCPYPMPQPAPAPEYIKMEPSPAEKARREALDKESAYPVEVHKALDPNKEWKVRCPRCGKLLKVRETSPYHRCPSCDKVFLLRKFETYVRKD